MRIRSAAVSALCLAMLAVAALTGCSVFDAKPAADSGFNPTAAPQATRAAFLQQVWVAPEYRGLPIRDRFPWVYIAPVDTDYIEKQTWWQRQNGASKEQLAKDTRDIAIRMRDEFNKAIANYPGGVIKPVTRPGRKTLIIELALVELVPSKAYWNAGATAAGFVVPGAGFLAFAGAGSIAMEGRARDGKTNKIISTFKDRRNDKAAPINLGSFTWYHGAETNIADWAAEFAELLNTPPDHVVKRPSAVTLRPW